LDSLRFRFHVARHLNVDPASVEADVLGEHGTSEVFMWSSAQVAGVRVLDALQQTDRGREELRRSIEQEVRYANITIIEGNQAGHELTVWNRTPDRAKPLAGGGATVAGSPAEAGTGAAFAITMLATPEALKEVVLGEHGLVRAFGPSQVYIDMSTVGPHTVRA